MTKVGTTLTVTVADGRIALGNAASPLVTLTGVNGTLVLTPAGVYGQVAADLQLDVPSITLTGSFKVRFNTTRPTRTSPLPEVVTLKPGFRVAATGVSISASPARPSAAASSSSASSGPGPTFTPEVRIAVADLTLTLGSAVEVLGSHHWKGALLITSSGVAATFSGSLGSGTVADPYVFTLGTGITVGGTVALVVNTSPVAVDETFTVDPARRHHDLDPPRRPGGPGVPGLGQRHAHRRHGRLLRLVRRGPEHQARLRRHPGQPRAGTDVGHRHRHRRRQRRRQARPAPRHLGRRLALPRHRRLGLPGDRCQDLGRGRGRARPRRPRP